MRITVVAKPGSRAPGIEKQPDGSLKVAVRARAQDGAANKELIEVLSKYFSIAKGKIRILKGITSKHKIIEIED